MADADAVIAVSDGMKADILATYPQIPAERVRVIRNGIDTDQYAPDRATDALLRHGIDPARPYVIFVGRITRQKGLPVLLRAAAGLDRAAQLVLCAGQADTPELLADVTSLVEGLRRSRSGVVWIPRMLPKAEVIQLLSHAAVFACPSLYEPLGIVNLEAMACATAVVASRTGGIPEVVADGDTGLLVPPDDPAALSGALTRCWRIRRWPPRWDWRAGTAPWPSSAGRPWPARPPRCTRPCSYEGGVPVYVAAAADGGAPLAPLITTATFPPAAGR